LRNPLICIVIRAQRNQKGTNEYFPRKVDREEEIHSDPMARAILMGVGCLFASSEAFSLPPTADDSRFSRRAAIAAAVALVPLASQPALAATTCLGKCPEDPQKVAERRAIQTGTSSATPPTFAALVAQSIQQREDALGMSLSEDDKKKIVEKVRAAYPGVK
jgi:cell envelope opacity-associated protein A